MRGLLERVGWFFGGAAATLGLSVALAAEEPDTLYRKLQVLSEVLSAIENHYVDRISANELVYGAARGAVLTLDPHSDFFTPETYQALVSNTEGEYAGVGIELGEQEDEPEVLSVFPDSPAHAAGVRAGDRLVSIDGKEVHDLSLDAAQRLLRGVVGSKVTFDVERKGQAQPITFTLTRAWIRVAPLEERDLGGGLRYVHLKTFSRRVAQELALALKRHPPKKGLVLDVRDNPGGLFDEAVAICDLFLESGPIVSAIGRDGRVVDEELAHPRDTEPNYPIAILINRGSASAAEVVAGALRDRGRARLFGERSYGKGSVQSILDLSDGSGLKLTIARYFTPSGRQIDGYGLDPDEVVTDGEDPLARASAWLAKKGR